MNVCEAWCCCCGEIWSKRVLPLRRKFVKEKECAWRRRIYRKYASCKWLKNAGLEFTHADVVVNISRGPPGQWFPETEHWTSAIFVGTSGIPPKLIYRSAKSYTLHEKTETHTPNDNYENFINTHLEAAAEYKPTKQRTKSRVPWETLAVREMHADMKTAFKCNSKNPTNTNALKLKKAQNKLANMYLKEQTEYIQNEIVEDEQSRIAWQTINKVSRRKSTAKAKLKATCEKEQIHQWKQYFENYSETLRKLRMNQSREL